MRQVEIFVLDSTNSDSKRDLTNLLNDGWEVVRADHVSIACAKGSGSSVHTRRGEIVYILSRYAPSRYAPDTTNANAS